MSDRNGRGGAPEAGATGSIVTDEQGRQVFVTADGERIVLDGPAPQMVQAGAQPRMVVRDDGGGPVFVFDPAETGAAAAVPSVAPRVPGSGAGAPPRMVVEGEDGGSVFVYRPTARDLPPAAPTIEPLVLGAGAVASAEPLALGAGAVPSAAGAEPAAGATGTMVTDEQGRQVFVTAEGERIVLDGPAPRMVEAGAQPRTVVEDEAGRPVFVFDEPGAAPAPEGGTVPEGGRVPEDGGALPVMGGIAPAPGTVLVTPSGERMVMGAAGAAGPQVVLSGRRARAADGSHIELRSDDIQEIIGTIPHWLVRWGISAIAVTLAAMLAISWFVKYPESADGRAIVTTAVAPVRLVPRAGGEVQRLAVGEGDRVQRGAPLAVLRNPADWRQVLELSERLERFEPLLAAGTPGQAGAWPSGLVLGDVQPAYAAFLQSLSDHLANTAGAWDAEKLAALREQVATHERLRGTLEGQQALMAEEVEIARRRRDRDRTLLSRELLSVDEAEASESRLIQAQQARENGRAALAANEVQLAAYRAQIVELQQRSSEEGRTRLVVLRGTFNGLREAIRKWEQDYLLRAPLAGRVSFLRPLSEGQFVAPSEPVMAVVPESGPVSARVELSQAAAGKVRPGQRVRIRFDSHPATEFGAVIGRVERLSLLAFENREKDDALYLAEVSLPDGLVTTYGRTLEFRQEMRGQAQVITEDRRLIERIFNQFRHVAETARG